ncbi:hypothetical protein TNCV_2421841 [Trichonephila clavipes]|nr:hypothetical protein TNCV_2421841 [Trichonephila clavipes]
MPNERDIELVHRYERRRMQIQNSTLPHPFPLLNRGTRVQSDPGEKKSRGGEGGIRKKTGEGGGKQKAKKKGE